MFGILCGLESEAKIAREIPGALVACAAARPHKARELARSLTTQGATHLISFGIAGALRNEWQLGDIVVGTRVVSARRRWICDAAWSQKLAHDIPGAKQDSVYGSETLIPTAVEKQNIYHATQCGIVDMESQCVAEIAAEAAIPFAVIRTVCDHAQMDVPPVVMAAIAEDGSVHVMRALAAFARQPSQLGALFHVMRGTGKALAALRQSTRFITP